MNNEKKNLVWHVANALVAGAISFFSAISVVIADKGLNDPHEIIFPASVAIITSALVFLYKIREYLDETKPTSKALNIL